MLLLLLCVGLTLVGAHEEEEYKVHTENFDVSKISGDWYSILLASDNKQKIENDGSMRIYVQEMKELPDKSLFLKYQMRVDGVCTEFTMVAASTDKSGCFEVKYDGDNHFCILETDYYNYLIFHLKNTKDGKSYQTMELYARKPDVDAEKKNKFGEMCNARNIFHIVNMTTDDRCPEDEAVAETESTDDAKPSSE